MGNHIYFNAQLSPQMYTTKKAPPAPKQSYYYKNQLVESVESLRQDNEQAKQHIVELNHSSQQILQDIQTNLNKLNREHQALHGDYESQQKTLQTLEQRQLEVEQGYENVKERSQASLKTLVDKLNALRDQQADDHQKLSEQLLVLAQLQEEIIKLKGKLMEEIIL
ncbi:chromosome segregation ATPase [Pullulanibacillus pueri]|uniref:Uncharacterized protein n=1 Tax=Pullulanibacillus pueri TaxID=1437324 RepID=A0A8J2ZVZ9_9BACL|nr:hypothetical protein [Pullulanibacillus pueri]MBM7682631.1 chromosome segregation ATPase [Pullulanibacillus pueri]GGH82581.1 hypothetical protein GCM10007096_22180 [Pullulanibacillus pueri]